MLSTEQHSTAQHGNPAPQAEGQHLPMLLMMKQGARTQVENKGSQASQCRTGQEQWLVQLC
jgi:hypothetical protein